MSDHDETGASAAMHDRLLTLIQNVLGLYSEKTFGRMGGARPFTERNPDFLDLLSAADIAGGAIGQYFSVKDTAEGGEIFVKEGADKVLGWLGHDALALKKLNIILTLGPNGEILSGPLNFTVKQFPEGTTFIPTLLVR